MKNQIKKLIDEYNSLQPFSEDCTKKLDKKFRLEFNYNSNHLEGNTLTYGETELLLLFDQTKGTHELRELEEMKAHDVALMMIKEEAAEKDKPLTEKFIKDLNQTILVRPFWKDAITSDGQNTRRQIKVGEYKEHPNSVIQANGEIFEYASPQETPILMAELVKWYNEETKKGELTPIELAALLHYRYIRIHPFDDGNGRVARLLVNYVMYRNKLSPVIIKTAEKKDYLRALQQADAGDLQAFIDYMTRQLAWSLDLSIHAAKGESIEEQDDWEKQLSLLKKGLGDKTNEVVKKSGESMANIFNNIILPFSDLLEKKISQFDSLFMSRQSILRFNSTPSEYFDSINIGLNRYISIFKNPSQKTGFNDVDEICISFRFDKYRNPFIDNEIFSFQLSFVFHKNAFAIQYRNIIISKLYGEELLADEMNAIISDIGKDLLQKIENLINS